MVSRMNERELEVALCYLLAIFGYVCNRCKRDVSTLHSKVQVDHINGNHFDHRLSNLQPLCVSCNNLRKNEIDSSIVYDRPLNYEQSKSIESMKIYSWIDERIFKFMHVCLAEVLSDGRKYAGVKEITARRRVNEELGSELGKYDLHQFMCESPICSGSHLFQKGFKPEQIGEATTTKPSKYIIKINEDKRPRDVIDITMDKMVLVQRLAVPLSTEVEAFEHFDISKHVTDVFENLGKEFKSFRER